MRILWVSEDFAITKCGIVMLSVWLVQTNNQLQMGTNELRIDDQKWIWMNFKENKSPSKQTDGSHERQGRLRALLMMMFERATHKSG